MSDQPFTPASLRGAIDLSGLAKKPARPASRPSATGGPGQQQAGAPGPDPLVSEVDDVTFGDAVEQSMNVPVIFALYSGARPASREHTDLLATIVREYAGRLVLAIADIDVAMQIRQALQVQQVPMVLALVKGQPLPLYSGDQPQDAVRDVFDKVLEAAAANGITGRVDVGEVAAPTDQAAEPEISPLHELAFTAIEAGDFDGAVIAYEQALAANPADEEAALGLGQVRLLQRTDGVDLNAARAEAAQAPTDVAKQTVVADLDILGGHVEDAFVRLVDLVKATTGDERNAARQHLLSLFDVVGAADPRVKKARTALMSALY
ncbi:MAG: tetratricopeptide repeat protein [Actinomycetota bacterium]|nr:tetratricopeptide repeat protein [Actinomycetota bacterium]